MQILTSCENLTHAGLRRLLEKRYQQIYVSVGVEELDQAKLTPLLRLKYHNSIADALAELGKSDEIGKVFNGFQRYLYQ